MTQSSIRDTIINNYLDKAYTKNENANVNQTIIIRPFGFQSFFFYFGNYRWFIGEKIKRERTKHEEPTEICKQLEGWPKKKTPSNSFTKESHSPICYKIQ